MSGFASGGEHGGPEKTRGRGREGERLRRLLGMLVVAAVLQAGFPFTRHLSIRQVVTTAMVWAAILAATGLPRRTRYGMVARFLALALATLGAFYTWFLTPARDPSTVFGVAVVVAGIALPAGYGLAVAGLVVVLTSLVDLMSGMGVALLVREIIVLAAIYTGFRFSGLRRESLAREERYLWELEDAHRRLQDAHTELQAAAERAVTLAATEERNRIARELHDILGHTLTVIVVQLQAVQRLLPGQASRASRQLETLEELSRQSLAEVRQVVRTMAEGASGEAGVIALKALVGEFAERTGIEGTFTITGPSSLEAGLSSQLFRILQECLTNARRHSQPSYVAVGLTVAKGKAELIVENDGAPERGGQMGGTGAGQASAPVIVTPGFGLRGMADRCAGLGGTLHFGLVPGGRFRVEAVLPLTANDQQETEGVEDN